jgi:hypothetical protein
LCDLVVRKVIINCDVQFVENEAWYGTIEKTMRIMDAMEHNEIEEEEVFQTPYISQCAVPSTPGTAMQITMHNTPVGTTGVQSTLKYKKHQQAIQAVLHLQIQI